MSIKVLVADDSITIQKVIGIIFGGDEYSLTVVDNGKAAVDKAREIDPDILLIDALMPGMTGYEVSEVVRSTPSLAHKPILILTGSFEPFDEEKAKKCGADDFIAKPFESQQIITKVKELLELGKLRGQSAQFLRQEPSPEFLREQALEVSTPISDFSTTEVFQQPVVAQPVAPDDIWGAFTPEVEPPVEAEEACDISEISLTTFEPDVFSIVTEENEPPLGQSAAAADTAPLNIGSQWVPVEENMFEFEEETIAEHTVPAQESTFGDISFEDEIPTPIVTANTAFSEPDITTSAPDFTVPPQTFDAPTSSESFYNSPVTAPETVPSPVSLTEEQLKAAITSASKEVIERIVWEVVPDLAEAMIREAIRKIKEGV